MSANPEPGAVPELPPARQFTRRTLLRLTATAGAVSAFAGLLAACSSQPSTGTTTSAPTTSTQSSTGASTSTTTTAASPAAAATTATQATPAPVAQKGGTVTVGVDQEPPTMDPHASPSAITYYMTSSSVETLLYLDDKRALKPWLAQKWEVASDAKTFTFHLITGATFQDGAPFNAAAVKWNFDRIVDPNFKAGGSLGSLSGYTGTDTPDDATAVVKFKESFVPFITYAAGGTLGFLSPKGTPAQGDKVNQTPITSGPYKISEYVPKQYVAQTRWDGYTRRLPWANHDGPGYLDKVVWKFIPEQGTRTATVQSGETQIATVIAAQDLPRFQSSKDFTVQTAPWTGAPQIWMLTVDRPPTDNLAVRQAINYAVDKDAIVNTIYKGTGTKAYAPLTMIMLDDPSLRAYYPHDVNKAKQILTDAGYTLGSDGIFTKGGQKLSVLLNAIDYGGGPAQIVQLIQGSLHDAGIDMQIKAQARAPWYEDNYKGATNGPVLFLRAGDWDGLYALFHSSNIGGNFNWSRLKDPSIDQALVQGRAEADPVKRKQLYLDLEKKLLDMAVSVPLIDELSVWVLRSNVTGLIFNGYTYPVITEMSLKS